LEPAAHPATAHLGSSRAAAPSGWLCEHEGAPHASDGQDLDGNVRFAGAARAASPNNIQPAQAPGVHVPAQATKLTQHRTAETASELQLARVSGAEAGALVVQCPEHLQPLGALSSACTDFDRHSESACTSVSHALRERSAKVAADSGALSGIVFSEFQCTNSAY
jgi:hypothetical protein